MPFSYLRYDVFTSEPLAGNALAVFPDARGIDPASMQKIAREMNLSETTFVLPAEASGTDVRMRIFTPAEELPIAGHPTIGTSFALAHAGLIERGRDTFVFGLGVGPVPVDMQWEAGALRFAWMTFPNPRFGPAIGGRAEAAHALGLEAKDLARDLPVQDVSCGVPYLIVPLRSREAVDRAVLDVSDYRALVQVEGGSLPIYLFAITGGPEGETVYARMFAPGIGITEDPATGSAAAPLGCYLLRHLAVTPEEAARIVITQGVAIGRRSRMHVAVTGTPERIAQVKVGGEAVLVGRGELLP